MNSLSDFNYEGKKVLVRVDINSPIDPETKKIVNTNRIVKSAPTIKKILDQGGQVALIAHQGDTLDYQNLVSLEEHANRLSKLIGYDIDYIDDVAGDSALAKIKSLQNGQAVLLGNLRYLTEEVSTFVDYVKLDPKDMMDCYMVRRFKDLFDCYVNEAFAAAHRPAPSMIAFQEFLPSAAGDLFVKEIENLNKVMESPDRPAVFVLGGAKISDAFGMMEQVLSTKKADKILTTGITGEIFLLASGKDIGETKKKFLEDKNLLTFVEDAKNYLENYPGKIQYPVDLAYSNGDTRKELLVKDLPQEEMFMDIGLKTIEQYAEVLKEAKTIFVNGPAGVYEETLFELGTMKLWETIAIVDGYSVIGGGDTVSAAAQYINLDNINYVCTAGGAMVRYLSGKRLPLIEAMEKAYARKK